MRFRIRDDADMVVDYVKRLRAAGRGQDEEAERIAGERGYANAAEMEAGENQREREMASFHDVAAAGRDADGARADLLADAQARLNDPNASEYEKQAARTVLRFKQRGGRDGVTAQGTEGDGVRFRVVRDPQEVERLERGKKVKRYRAMQLINGKLYPPMSARVNGQLREPTELGVWEQADENPELARNGKFRLDKGQKGQGTVDAAYNPYFHTSTSAMNDQFSSAWKRPELVVVEVEIPESELTSGYRAEGAKDSVGDTDWKSGSVNNALPADRQRTVTLSRYMKAVRIVPDAEVADMIARQLEGTDIAVPFNVVNESLRSELVKRGVRIGEPEGSNAGRASRAAYEQWKNGTTVSERSDDIAEREVANVVVESVRDKLPTNRKVAKRMLDQMSQPFHNNDQGVDIYVSHGDATHMMNFRNDDQIKVVGVIDRVIANAVKIGEVPVHEDEATTTKAVHIYYCPINIDGKQYSGRMVVKEYFQGNQVVDELHLYNTQLRKETPNAQSHSPEGIPAHPSEVKNRYKVKELIHSTQEGDRKLLGIGSNSPTLFRVRRAPNGKESNLDERQYDEVRTGNFKKWFGDWERVAQRNYILSDKYVTSLKGDEFAKTDEPLTDRVAKYYSDNYAGQIERENFGVVILDRRGVKDSISHGIGRTKSAAFAAVPEIIRDGIQIDQQENWKGRNQDSFTFAAPIEIGGKGHVGIVIVTRGKGSQRNRFYLHEVVIQENLQNESIKTGTKADSHHGDVAKVLKEIATAKNSSKIVDANGEPLVVYHGTKGQEYYWKDGHPYTRNVPKFYTFKSGFFTPDREAALVFADGAEHRVYATYLDIKRPLEIDAHGDSFEEIRMPDGSVMSTDRIVEQARQMGDYDGVIIRNVSGESNGNVRNTIDDYIPFRPEQIKSATENNGDFSRESGDIRFRLRGEHETGDRVREKEEKGYRSLFDGIDDREEQSRPSIERERSSLKEQLARSSDEELLRKIGESSAEDRTFYSEEYDRRHLKEYNEMCDNYWKMLNDGKVEFEQAEEMLIDAVHDWREGHASAERTRLLAQFDTLNAYYAEKQEEAWEREDAEHDGPVESATSPRNGEQVPLPTAPTPTFDPTAIGLRQLTDGEASYVQRRYERSGQFDFTGSERIESADDVAYIFRNLENSAIENVFLVLVKDGRGTILHVGMGDYRTSLGHLGAGYLAASELRPDKVVMVHNHPSGSLEPSRADLELHNKVVRMFGDDVVAPSIIIDTTRGEYSEFEAMADLEIKSRKRSSVGEIPYDTYTFSRQVFAPGYNPATAFTVRSSEDVAKFVSSHRLGERPKVSLIVLDNRNHVVGNVFLPYTELKAADASRVSDETARYVHQMGGNRAILYGRVGSVDVDAVKSIKSALRDRDVSLVDFIDVNRGSYNDRGVLNEEGARYNSDVRFSVRGYDKKVEESFGGREKMTNFAGRNTDILNIREDEYTDDFRRIQAESQRLSDEDVRQYHRGRASGKYFSDEKRRALGAVYARLLTRGLRGGPANWINLTGKGNQFRFAQVNGQLFHDIFEINRRYLENGELVDLHDNYDDVKCFISDDGLCGFAIEPNGNLVSVFSLNPDNRGGFLYAIRDFAREQGMTHGDAYNSAVQPLAKIYEKTLGLKTVSVMDYNMDYDHDDIARNHGNPDVVFMVVNDGEIETRRFSKDDYDAAVSHQQSQLPKDGRSDVRFRVRDGRHGSDGIEGLHGEHEAAVEDARRRLESDDASEFEKQAARAVINAYGGGSGDTPDGGVRFRTRDDADMLVDMAKHNNEVARQRRDAVTDFVKAITDVDELTDSKFATALGKVMRGQRQYDQETVADITTMVKAMMDAGLLTELDNFSVKQILTKVKDSTGKNDITAEANKLIDIMLKHQLRRGKRAFEQQLKVKGMRQDSRGVVVQKIKDY